MANQIKTRIFNKYDLLTNWNNATTFYPRAGEICLANLGTQQIETNGENRYEPIIGIKVGIWDGVEGSATQKNFSQLQWVQAVAGDVSSFIKGLNKQEDFDTYVKNLINTGYITDVTDRIDKLTQRVGALETTVNDSATGVGALNTKLGTLEGTVNTLSGNVTTLTNNKADKTQVATDIAAAKTAVLGTTDEGADFAGTVKGAYANASAAQDAADRAASAASVADGKAVTAQGAAEAAQGAADAAQERADNAYALAETANSTANANAGEIATIKEDIADINELIGGTDGQSVSARLTALEEKDGVHDKSIQDNTDAIATEKSRAEGIEAGLRTDVNKALAFLNDATIDPENTKLVDTLKEIQEYITSDETGASEMLASIQANTQAIEDEVSRATEAEGNLQNNIDKAKNDLLGEAGYVGTIKGAYEAAAAADTKAGNAATAAATADGKAVAAQSTADTALANAATADGKAVAAQGAAEAAQGTANTALANAATADGKAVAAQNAVDALIASSVAEGAGKISTISFEEGKIKATRKLIDMTDFSDTATFIFDCGSASVTV